MTLPSKERWFDDFRAGEVFEFGDRLLDEVEIVAFARQFDPQPFHVDPARRPCTRSTAA